MKIAILSWESLHSISVGGVGAHVTELACSLERKGHETQQGKTARDVLNMRIQTSILVNDDDAWQLRRHLVSCIGAYGPHEIPFDTSVPLRRRDGFVAGLDAVIGL